MVYFFLNLDRGDTHVHNIEVKRCKFDNDSANYLWHCHLGHIGVKCTKKLHADELIESLDYESVGERSNFKKIPTHTQDHGDA